MSPAAAARAAGAGPAGAAVHPVRPVLVAGRRAVVDGRAVCAGCGGPVVPVGPGAWAHGREPTEFLRPVDRASVGLSYREAARALRVREGTIMSRLFRARDRVAAQLEGVAA